MKKLIFFNLNKSKNIFYENDDFEKASKIFLGYLLFQNKKKILIFGDYDVDGYSSTYLLYDFIINQQMKCDFWSYRIDLKMDMVNKTLIIN